MYIYKKFNLVEMQLVYMYVIKFVYISNQDSFIEIITLFLLYLKLVIDV